MSHILLDPGKVNPILSTFNIFRPQENGGHFYRWHFHLTHWGRDKMAAVLQMTFSNAFTLTHWGRVTHICVSKLIIISSDNGLSPGRRQAIIWTNAGIMLIGLLGTNFSEIDLYIFIQENAFENVLWKVAAILSWPQCVNENYCTLIQILPKYFFMVQLSIC